LCTPVGRVAREEVTGGDVVRLRERLGGAFVRVRLRMKAVGERGLWTWGTRVRVGGWFPLIFSAWGDGGPPVSTLA
jgi:hypothetical protein